jgi:type II secretory pathway component GspD/PulD (secretin)
MTLLKADGVRRWLVLSLLCLAGGTVVFAAEPADEVGDVATAAAAEALAPTEADPTTEPDPTTEAALVDAAAAASNDPLLPSAVGEPARDEQAASNPATGLRFSFSGAPWREVLNWLAEESDLALHVGDVPGGSFTYSDPTSFSTDEAIARVNLFLIPQGYAVVRRGQLLSVISLGDPRSLQQLDALATLTPLTELEKRSDHEVVKCLVPLGTINAAEVTAELQPMMLMIAPVVLPKSNQLILTETAGKIRSVLAVIRAMESSEPESVVQRFDLQHVDVDTVLMIAGSHLGLTAGATAGADISISTDASGKSLYVTGTQDKIERLQTLLKTLDVPGEQEESTAAMHLRSHRVTGDNLQAVYDVLQTVLAGKSLRLSMQPNTSSIVALADDSVHQQIEDTIQEMQAPAMDFAVIDLQTLDPYFVVSLIGEMFGSQSATDTRSWRDRSRSEETTATAPKVDADPGNRRLFVRGTTDQVAQIRQMVESLDSRRAGREEVRVVPLRGQHRQQVLQAAERFWRGDNQVQILPSIEGFDHHDQVIERAVHPNQSSDRPVSAPAAGQPSTDDPYEAGVPRRPLGEAAEAFVSLPTQDTEAAVVAPATQAAVTKVGRKSVAPIRGQLVPQGVLLQSDDLAALDRFQDHLLEIAASSKNAPSPPIVYYLKYVNAEDAVKMLADLLDGGQSLAETPPGTLINGRVVGSSGSYFGSFTTKREGMTTVTAGTATIVSDARLNRLIVQGTAEDVSVIEGYLRIIDKGNSITNIETFGRSHVIELMHTKAADVAEMVKEAYAGRIAGAAAGAQPNRGGPPPAAPNQNNNSQRSDNQGQRDVAEKPTRGRQAEMTVAVHESSNSLVITAPDALFAEVEELIRSVDVRSEQVTEVIPAAAGVDLETILQALNGESPSSSRSSRSDRRGDSRDSSRGYSRSR